MSRRVPSIAVAAAVTVWLCALLGAQSSPSPAAPPVSFTTDGRPILDGKITRMVTDVSYNAITTDSSIVTVCRGDMRAPQSQWFDGDGGA
jgi:hypothetical protein